MKKCAGCGLEKEIAEFTSNKSKKDGLSVYCRACARGYSKTYYKLHKKAQIKRVELNKKEKQKGLREFLKSYFELHPCTDCGETDIRVLEFDHIRDKFRNISRMMSGRFSLAKIREEIEKCEVVCSNCHKRRTYTRKPVWRNM